MNGDGGGGDEAQRRVPGECFTRTKPTRMYNDFSRRFAPTIFVPWPFHSGLGNARPAARAYDTSQRYGDARSAGRPVPNAVRRA